MKFLSNIWDLTSYLFVNCKPKEDFGDFSINEMYLRFSKLSMLKNVENDENKINWSKDLVKYLVGMISKAVKERMEYRYCNTQFVRVSDDVNWTRNKRKR